jgi:hypothetical protein
MFESQSHLTLRCLAHPSGQVDEAQPRAIEARQRRLAALQDALATEVQAARPRRMPT